MDEDFERFHRFVQARDPRYDGWFVVGVTGTGIFCQALERLGHDGVPGIDERWRPWRSYAVAHLWASLA